MIEASGSAIRLNIDFAASSEGLGRSAFLNAVRVAIFR